MAAKEKRIARNPRVCHGRPCIKGTRVLVSVIRDCYAKGVAEAEILEHYPSLKAGDTDGIRPQ